MDWAVENVNNMIRNDDLIRLISFKQQKTFSLSSPKVVVGQIASGDQFFSNNEEKKNLLTLLPEVLCVEMEGAAVAQVCFEYKVPYVIIRTISDESNENSVVDFNEFVTQVASKFGVAIIQKLIQ
ncbi:nucleosidase [Flavobacteriaceae bacterium]